jgi:hypothetical protein
MNLIRANNKEAGSPVNRVLIFAETAAKGASLRRPFGTLSYLSFRMRMYGISFIYHLNQWWGSVSAFFGKKRQNFEEQLDKFAQRTMHEKFGLKMDFE